jgi:HEAT repeat protein
MTRTTFAVLALALLPAIGLAQTHDYRRVAPVIPAVPRAAHAPTAVYVPSAPMALSALPVAPVPMAMPLGGWESQDPADSLYNRARRELNSGNFRRAAELFEQFIDAAPRSQRAPDAYYWWAYALYKTNGTDELEDAKALLERQRARMPQQLRGEANELLVVVETQLARRGNAAAAEDVTRRSAQALAQGCPRRDDDDIRDAALQSLMQMDAENAIPVLKRIMAKKDECSALLRRKAVFQISQQRSTEREDMLLDAARTDPDPEVRRQAVFWLSQVNTPKALDAIQEILNSSNDRSVQENALFALSQQRSTRAGEILRAWATGDRPAALREKAIFHLSQQRDPANGAFLRELYPKLNDERLKRQVLFALSQRRSEGNEKWLMDIALDEKEPVEVRKQALFFAGQMRGAPTADLIALYDRMTNRVMKEQLIYVYSQIRATDVVDKMMDIAKNEKDIELRKKALFWLSQSKDPRVAKFLLEIIER